MSDNSGYIPFLAEARSGDRAAMGHLARVVWDRVYAFAFRTTLDHNAAEDVVQETLLAMICRLGTLRDSRRFWPWIYRIAWSKIQNGHRDRRLRSCLEARLLHAKAAARRTCLRRHAPRRPDPRGNAAADLRRRRATQPRSPRHPPASLLRRPRLRRDRRPHPHHPGPRPHPLPPSQKVPENTASPAACKKEVTLHT